MNTLNRNAAGFAVGTVAAVLHALLSLGVWLIPDVMQKIVDFDMALHFMKMDVVIQPFSLVGAITIVILSFCIGYAMGCAIASIYNEINNRG